MSRAGPTAAVERVCEDGTVTTDRRSNEIEDVLAAFEKALREALEDGARESAAAMLDTLSVGGGPFVVSDVEFDVVIRNLTVKAAAASTSHKESTRARKRPARSRAAVSAGPAKPGRKPGPVRSAILDVFSEGGAELDTAALRRGLDERGVVTSADNLHQQLRRLVTAGELERKGRGLYQRR